jgi:hypothetical protein
VFKWIFKRLNFLDTWFSSLCRISKITYDVRQYWKIKFSSCYVYMCIVCVCVYIYTLCFLTEPKTPLLELCQTIIIKTPNHFYIVTVQLMLNVHLYFLPLFCFNLTVWNYVRTSPIWIDQTETLQIDKNLNNNLQQTIYCRLVLFVAYSGTSFVIIYDLQKHSWKESRRKNKFRMRIEQHQNLNTVFCGRKIIFKGYLTPTPHFIDEEW